MKKPAAVLIVLLTVVLFAACMADSSPIDPTRPVSKATTTPNVTASPTAISPTPNILPAATASPTATTLPVPTPTPTPVPGLVASAAHITVGDWSPDGRFLTYWTHTAEDLTTNPQFPTGNFHFYSTDQEQSCPFGGYRTGSTDWQRRHLWLPNSDVLIFGDEDVGSFYPCSLNFVILTDEFPEPIRRVIAHDVERARFLLASESGYWLFRADGLDAQPVTGFAEGFDNGASFSPNGRLVALIGDNGGSYLLDTASATVTKLADWEARGHLAGPEWLDNERFLIHGSHDRGPLIIGIDGSVQNLGLALFGRATGPEDIAFAVRESESGTFHLLLETAAGSLLLYHSELDAVTEISLPSAEYVDASFSPNGCWLLLTTRSAGNPPRVELWRRAVVPTVSQPTRIYSGADVPFTRLGPDDSLALKVGHYINILHLPHGERMAGQGYGRYEAFPYSWSPDGRFLAVIGNAQGNQEQALFVLPVHASPEGGS